MRKIGLILFFFTVGVFYQLHFLYSQPLPGEKNNLGYRFEFRFQGEATGVLLFFFRYRFFVHAEASVLLTATKTAEKTLRFSFVDIDKTGYLFRTWGFSGKTFVSAAADYDVKKARQVLAKVFLMFKDEAPYYAQFIKRRKLFPFKILSRGSDVLTFNREMEGIHRDCSLDLPLQAVEYEEKYGFYFKIYPMLAEMVKLYDHSFLPGNCEKVSQLELDMKWPGPDLDYSGSMNRIGAQASKIVEKFVTFEQKSPFRLTYRVVSRTPGMLTIHGEAVPEVKIWDGYKIIRVTRTIAVRLPDEVVLSDKFHIEIRKKEGKCGFAQCALTLVR